MMDWNIQARAHLCQACHRHFADNQAFHTLLFDHKGAYHRLDVCEECWESQYSQGAADRKGFLSHWQSTYTSPARRPPEPIQKDTAESLLRKLVERNDPAHLAAGFILAVMLERKRLLRAKATLTNNGKRILVYEHPKTGDVFQIVDPQLQLDQLEQVQRDVADLLEHGLPEPPQQQGGDSTALPEPPASEPPAEAAVGSVAEQADLQAKSEE